MYINIHVPDIQCMLIFCAWFVINFSVNIWKERQFEATCDPPFARQCSTQALTEVHMNSAHAAHSFVFHVVVAWGNKIITIFYCYIAIIWSYNGFCGKSFCLWIIHSYHSAMEEMLLMIHFMFSQNWNWALTIHQHIYSIVHVIKMITEVNLYCATLYRRDHSKHTDWSSSDGYKANPRSWWLCTEDTTVNIQTGLALIAI